MIDRVVGISQAPQTFLRLAALQRDVYQVIMSD